MLRKSVVKILNWSNDKPDMKKFAALFLVTYVFLLRLPSEALDMVIGEKGLHLVKDQLVLVLPRRHVLCIRVFSVVCLPFGPASGRTNLKGAGWSEAAGAVSAR